MSRFSARRIAALATAVLSVVAIAALIISAFEHRHVRAFALRVPNVAIVAQLRDGQRACEGPVTAPHAIQAVGVWGASALGLSRISADLTGPGGRRWSSPPVDATHRRGYTLSLGSPVPAGTAVRVCVRSRLNTFVLAGAPTRNPAGFTTRGTVARQDFSLNLLSRPESLLDALAVAFTRASLFKLSWIGSWTYWLLAAGLLACFLLAVAAVASAAGADAGAQRDSDAR